MKSKRKVLYPTAGRNPDYLDDYGSYTHKECTKCGRIKKVSEFSKSVQRNRIGWAYRSQCKRCSNEKTRLYANNNKQKRNDRLKQYRKNNPLKVKALDRRKALKRNYGITVEDYEKMVQKQGGLCFICQLAKRLVVDHCHKTGKVRNLLCHGCNTVLGKIEKGELDIFKKYIESHADKKIQKKQVVH